MTTSPGRVKGGPQLKVSWWRVSAVILACVGARGTPGEEGEGRGRGRKRGRERGRGGGREREEKEGGLVSSYVHCIVKIIVHNTIHIRVRSIHGLRAPEERARDMERPLHSALGTGSTGCVQVIVV